MSHRNQACPSHRGLPRIPEGTRGKVRIPGYNDAKQKPKRAARPKAKTLKPAPPKPKTPKPKAPKPKIFKPESVSRARAASPGAERDMKREVRLAADQAKRLRDKGTFTEVERRASVHAAEQWHRVVNRPSMHCHGLARFARLMLNGHDRARAALATAAEGVAVEEEKELVNALVRRFPLPGSAEVVLAARALQLAGIVMCMSDNVPLRRCPVLIDVVEVEGRRLLKALIRDGAEDWTGLAALA